MSNSSNHCSPIAITEAQPFKALKFGDITFKDDFVTVQIRTGTGKEAVAPFFVFPKLRMPYLPSPTTYGGKAKFETYHLPLECNIEAMAFLTNLEGKLQNMVFGQRGKLPASVTEGAKRAKDIKISLVYQADKKRDDGEAYSPIFQPRMPKRWNAEKQVTPLFNIEATKVDLNQKVRKFVLTDLGIDKFFHTGCEVATIVQLRQIVVKDCKITAEMDVKQMVCFQREVKSADAYLPKNMLRETLGLKKPEECSDDDDDGSLERPVARKRKVNGQSAKSDDEDEPPTDGSFTAAASSVVPGMWSPRPMKEENAEKEE